MNPMTKQPLLYMFLVFDLKMYKNSLLKKFNSWVFQDGLNYTKEEDENINSVNCCFQRPIAVIFALGVQQDSHSGDPTFTLITTTGAQHVQSLVISYFTPVQI